ncbi:low affinity potassium transporter [Zalaria obscura]|uniref:Low affinity potassium transporter n=1 Tax=Zalaria obscura TaxID=2024903 RepID=A0ACC3SEG5_9PEZI
MIGLAIAGSILLYPAGGMAYIDALFFASGAATQSGLNTIDVNKLHLYQQIVLYLMACVANPVFINTIVVFIRLYWFEKRFEHIVTEARNRRQTRTKSRTVSEMRADPDPGRIEAGVNGRTIRVLHDTTVGNGMSHSKPNALPETEKEPFPRLPSQTPSRFEVDQQNQEGSDGSGDSSQTPLQRDRSTSHLGLPTALKRDITFADELPPSKRPQESEDDGRVPVRRSTEQHIAFLQKQRNTKDKGALRIPGPRDFDRGDMPREVDSEEEGDDLHPVLTRNTLPETPDEKRPRSSSEDTTGNNEDDHPVKRGITIDEPDKPVRTRDRGETTSSSHAHARFNPLMPFAKIRHHRSVSIGPSFGGLRQRTKTLTFSRSQGRSEDMEPMPYLSWQPTIGRNSAFVDLTEEQREELGGIEYRSLKTLACILIFYYLGFHILGVVVFLPWIIRSGTWGPIVDQTAINRTWWGIFTPASMFNDLGFTLTPDSMMSFQTAVMPLLFGSFLIIIGNTGFPCMLRFVIWVLSLIVPVGSGIWEELRFLLDHPRRCFTLLFPSKATWWLFWVLFGLNAIDLIFFVILDLNDPIVTVLAPGFRVLDGWFQAASTRTAGFACVNLAELHPAIQVSYLIMMYISVFPIAISVRRTNVYEEKSLGIFGGEEEEDEEGRSYVGQHLRRQLSFDLWYIFLGFFIIAIVEGNRLQNTNDYVSTSATPLLPAPLLQPADVHLSQAFTMFSVLFEIVSAYGTVGLSLGYPTINASFSAEFAVISKLIICAMMIRGRHRGLPYALDRAILLPSESLNKKEHEEAERRQMRRNSMMTATTNQGGDAEDFEMDRVGLPRQHTREREGAMEMGAGGPIGLMRSAEEQRASGGDLRKMHTRRGSEISQSSEQRRKNGRRLSGWIVGGLSAGPTNRKLD